MKSQILPGQTETWVHTEESMIRQREKAEGKESAALNGLSIFGQIMIGSSLYLNDHVSTPGYLSIALTIPYALLICFLGHWLLYRDNKREGSLWIVGRKASGILAVFLSMLGWMNGQLAFYALCAMVSDILPTVSSFLVALSIAVTMAFALGGQGGRGLFRVSRLIGYLIFFCIFYCAMTALPYGEAGHLFPLLGHGMGNIFRGALWMCGCVSGACMPLLKGVGEKVADGLHEKQGMLLRPVLTAVALGMAAALLGAYLLPVYALARPETMGYRLLLLARVSPSVAGWSLLVCAMMLLMLMTLGEGVQRCGQLFSNAIGKKKTPLALTTGILLSYVPAGALNIQPLEHILLRIAPFRALLMLAVLLFLCVYRLWRNRKNAPEKEANS